MLCFERRTFSQYILVSALFLDPRPVFCCCQLHQCNLRSESHQIITIFYFCFLFCYVLTITIPGHYQLSCLLCKTRHFGDWFLFPSEVEPIQLGPVDRTSQFLETSFINRIGVVAGVWRQTISNYWAQLRRFHQNTETESSLLNIVF
jgi:hypothetical protein